MTVAVESVDAPNVSRKTTYIFALIGALVTVFDAVASYISIAQNKTAVEANEVLNLVSVFVSNTFSLGYEQSFGITMVLRAVFGIVLIGAILLIANKAKKDSERRLAKFGVIGVAVILTGVALYHLVGLVFFS